MRRTVFMLVVVAFAWLGIATQSAAQTATLQPDAALAKRGRSLFTNRGCEACHSIGKGKRAGPDLAGVMERRDLDWLRRWLKNTTAMLESDSTAKALLAEYNGVRMPAQKLADADIEALLQYIAQESAKKPS